MYSLNMTTYSKEYQLTSPEAMRLSLEWKSQVTVGSFALIFFLLGAVLNSVIIASFLYSRRAMDIIEALVFNLAIGDILSSFAFPLPLAVQFIARGTQIGGGACKLLAWLGVVSVSVTSISLVAIAYCISRRVKSQHLPQSGESMFCLGIFIIWVLPAFEGLPYLATVDWRNEDCAPTWSQSAQTAYVVVLFLLQIIIPLALLTKMTVTTSIANYRMRFAADHQIDSAGNSCVLGDDSDRFLNQKSLRMLNILATAFFIIVIPYTFFHLWLSLDIDNVTSGSHIGQVYITFHLLLCSKSFLCPLVYLTVWDVLKQDVYRLLCRCCKKRKQNFTSVMYTMTVRSNGHDVTGKVDGGEAIVLAGEMPIIEEVAGERNHSEEKLFNSVSSSDYDLESEDTYRDDVAIL